MTPTSLKIIVVIVLILLGGSLYLTFSGKDTAPKETEQEVHVSGTSIPKESTGATDESPAPVASPEVASGTEKVFTVKGNNFAFFPTTLTVNKGDKVKIIFENTGGFHDLKIDAFKVATKKIEGDKSDSVEFIADKTGSFEYYCSVGSHRAMGMKGTLIVK